jgi:hypothetical protein
MFVLSNLTAPGIDAAPNSYMFIWNELKIVYTTTYIFSKAILKGLTDE